MAAGVRVGNALGAGNASGAKRTVKVALTLVGNLKKDFPIILIFLA